MIGMIESVAGYVGYTKPTVLGARWGRADQKPKVYAGGAKNREKNIRFG